MATEAQYQCFKDIYDRETKRGEQLIDRGKIYLSVITLYMGLLGVAFDKITPMLAGHCFEKTIYILSLIIFIFSLALVIFSIGIYCYRFPTDPETVIFSFGTNQPLDNDFFDARIADFTVAFKENLPVNEKRANLLKYASWLMLFGISCQAYVLSSIIIMLPLNEGSIMTTKSQLNTQETQIEKTESGKDKEVNTQQDYGEHMKELLNKSKQQQQAQQQENQQDPYQRELERQRGKEQYYNIPPDIQKHQQEQEQKK
jgi:hypothetical protein